MSRESWKIPLSEILGKLYPSGVKTILDVACGLSVRSAYLKADIRVGVDIHDPYLEKAKEEHPSVIFVKHDVRRIGDLFLPKSFDLVIALDIVEHLTKKEAYHLLHQMEKVAKIAVIIETPSGYIPQNVDIQGLGGDWWQTHRSGWDRKEFEALGYKTILRDYTMQDVKRHTEIDNQPTEIQLIDAIKYV